MVKLSIIIVNFNVKDYLKELLDSLKTASGKISSEIIVVDNDSVDGSQHMVKSGYPEVILIENETNEGFASGCNTGIKQSSGDFILLINPDCLVNKDTLEKMLDFFEEHEDCGLAGCKILNTDGSIQLACRRSFPTPASAFFKLTGLSRLFQKSRIFGKYNLSYLPEDQIAEIDAVSGSFMMFRRDIIQQIGYLDETYFMYGEDLDFCFRIKEKGWKIYYNPETHIVHHKGKSSEKGDFDQIKTFYKAMDIFVKSHYKTRLFLPYFYLIRLGIFFRACVSVFKSTLIKLRSPFIDLLIINLSFLTAVSLRFGGLISLPIYFDIRSYILIMGVLSTVYMSFLFFGDIYTREKESVSRTLLLTTLAFFTVSGLTFFFNQFAFSRLVVFYSGIFIMLIIPGRKLAVFWFKFRQKKIRKKTRFVLVSKPDQIENLDALITNETSFFGYVLIREPDVLKKINYPVLGNIDKIYKIIEKNKISDLIYTPETILYNKSLSSIIQLSRKNFSIYTILQDQSFVLSAKRVKIFGNFKIVPVDLNINFLYNKFLKRTTDILISVSSLILLSIPFILNLIFSGIKIKTREIRGFHQDKFIIRSLFKNDQLYDGFYRNYLNFWYILRGNLTLIGDEITSRGINTELLFKPGIIDTPFKKADYDESVDENTLFYLKNYTFLLDLKVIINDFLKK